MPCVVNPLGIYNRHNELRNEFALVCKELGLQVELEKGSEVPVAEAHAATALKNSCSMSDAAMSCRARLALAVVRGLAQLESFRPGTAITRQWTSLF